MLVQAFKKSQFSWQSDSYRNLKDSPRTEQSYLEYWSARVRAWIKLNESRFSWKLFSDSSSVFSRFFPPKLFPVFSLLHHFLCPPQHQHCLNSLRQSINFRREDVRIQPSGRTLMRIKHCSNEDACSPKLSQERNMISIKRGTRLKSEGSHSMFGSPLPSTWPPFWFSSFSPSVVNST